MKTKLYPISYVLRYAADECLKYPGIANLKAHTYSCVAIELALSDLYADREVRYQEEKRIKRGLRNMGLNPDEPNFHRYMQRRQAPLWGTMFDATTKSQEMRHSWLYFAAMIAEEQGE